VETSKDADDYTTVGVAGLPKYEQLVPYFCRKMTTFIPTKWEVKRLTPCQKDGMASQPDSLTVLLPFGK
jgi:hypothetical protein